MNTLLPIRSTIYEHKISKRYIIFLFIQFITALLIIFLADFFYFNFLFFLLVLNLIFYININNWFITYLTMRLPSQLKHSHLQGYIERIEIKLYLSNRKISFL